MNQKIIKEFEKRFPEIKGEVYADKEIARGVKDEIKSFLLKALQDQREETVKEIEEKSFVEVITQKKIIWLEDIKNLIK